MLKNSLPVAFWCKLVISLIAENLSSYSTAQFGIAQIFSALSSNTKYLTDCSSPSRSLAANEGCVVRLMINIRYLQEKLIPGESPRGTLEASKEGSGILVFDNRVNVVTQVLF